MACDTIAPSVAAIPVGGTYEEALTVILEASEEGCVIYYTLDDTEPGMESAAYEGPLTADTPTTLTFKAVDLAGNWSEIYTERYVIVMDSWDIYTGKQKDSGNDWTCNENFGDITQFDQDLAQTMITYVDSDGDDQNDTILICIKDAYAGYYNEIVFNVLNTGQERIYISGLFCEHPNKRLHFCRWLNKDSRLDP